MREQRERERKLVLRHRWYAGGIAAVLSGALIFSGVTPAVAETIASTPTPSATDTATPAPAESTPAPAESTPAEQPSAPTEAPAATPSPEPTATTDAGSTPAARVAPQTLTTTTTTTPGPVLACVPNTFYSISSGANLRQVTGSTITSIGDWGDYGSANGIAIGANGAVAYAYERSGNLDQNISTILRYTQATGSWQAVPNTSYSTGNTNSLVAGAMNLATGDYLFGGYSNSGGDLVFRLYSFTPSSSAITYLGWFDTGLSGDATANGDIAFDAAGNLYVVRSGGRINIYTVTAATLASAGGGELARSETLSTTLTGLSSVNGIAFNADGTVFLGNDSTVKKYDPTTWTELSTATTGLSSSTDLASCNSPATFTVLKNVVGRAAAGDQFTLTVKNGSTTVATATTSGTRTGVQAQQIGPLPVPSGTVLNVSEAMASGSAQAYTTTWSCTNGTSGTGTSFTATIPNVGGASLVCTFTNAPLVGDLQIKKVVSGGGVAGSTPFTVDYTCGTGFSGSVTVTSSSPASVSNIPNGTSCTVSEPTSQLTASKLADTSYSWDVSGSGAVSPSASQTIVTGQTKVFTVTNKTTRNYGGITITKQLAGGISTSNLVSGATFTGTWVCEYPVGTSIAAGTWTVTGTGAATLTATQGSLAQIPLTSKCAATENQPTDSLFTDASYSWASSAVAVVNATVGANAPAAFTVTNTGQRSSLKLVKSVTNSNGGTLVGNDWSGKLRAGGYTFDNQQVRNVAAGAYLLSEDAVAGYKPGTPAFSCTGGTLNGATVTVPKGANVVCTFNNVDIAPKLTLEKKVVNTGGGIATADKWVLTATGEGSNAINGKGAPAGQPIASITGDVKAGVTYTLSESSGPSGYDASDWSCVLTGTDTSFPVSNGNKVTPQIGKDITCRIVNTAKPGTGQVSKTVTSTVQNPNGTWTITYQIVVTNTSASSTYTYDLKDVLNYGGGITPSTPTVTGPDGVTIKPGFTGAGQNTVIASNVSLPKAVGSHAYTVVVTAEVADAVADNGNGVCKAEGSAGGFLNTATIYKPGTSTVDGTSSACSEPVFPTIDKKGKPATQNADASFGVEYTITVSNPSDKTALQAALTDAFPAAPSGWTLVGGSWAVTAAAGTPAPTAATYAPGTGSIWSGILPAKTTYTYTVKGTLAPGSDAVAIGDCKVDGGGLKNKATVTSGQVVSDDTGCVTIVLPPVSIVKSDAGAVTQVSLTTWEIVYDVTVRNTSDTAATVYTLTDTPAPGTGWTLDAASGWLSPAPVANTVLEAKGSDTFRYRMVVTRDTQVKDPSLTCSLTDGGAFFNRATVAFPGGTASDTGCGAPGAPTVVKTGKPATSNGDGTYSIAYDVEVSNTSGKTLFYSLTDTPPTAPAGTSISGWKVTGTGASAAWPSPNVIAERSIPSGTTHTYTITAQVAIGAGFSPVPGACGEGTVTGVAIVNTATVANGVKTSRDDGCTSVNAQPVTVDKTFVSAQQQADGSWTVNYTVAVKGPQGGTTPYTLTDTPAFAAGEGVTFTGLSWTGQTTGSSTTAPATLQTDGLISAGQTHTWNVVATASIAVPSGATLGACVPGKSGPFFNTATVSFPGGSKSDSDCGAPAAPTMQKAALAPSFDAATGQWTLAYTLTVTNGKGMNLAYTLGDAPAALPTGVTGLGPWTVSGPAVSGGVDGVDEGALAAWNGASGTVATGLISNDATHVYTVTRTVAIAPSVTDSALSCDVRGGGIRNQADVWNGVGGNKSDACITIDRPSVKVDKTVTSTSQNADGTWNVSYDVTVTNQSPDLTAVYDLTDRLEFGAGIGIESASWAKGDAEATPFTAPLDGAQTLAAGALLAQGATDTYTVVVTASIRADAWKDATSKLVCEPQGSKKAGGFLNTATVTAGGESSTADDCATPKLPSFTKVGVSATQSDRDATQWLVTYELRVTSGGYATAYSLSDTPAFAGGIEVLSGDAQRTDVPGKPIAVTAGEDFVSDVPLGAAETHVYRITWLVDVTEEFNPAIGVCDGTGSGFFNTAALSVGDVEIPGEACIPVEDRVYPVPTKTVTSTTQNPATGDWTIVYEVKVALAASGTPENPKGLAAEYDLTDTLDFGAGIDIGSAQWKFGSKTADFQGDSATFATGKRIAAGQTDVYTVTVVAAVTTAAIGDGTTACSQGDAPAGGFFNTALLTSGGTTSPVEACAEPVFPEIAKRGGTPVQNPESGTWTIEYFVDVTYPDAGTTPLPTKIGYDLTDQPELPAGVALIGDWTAEPVDETTPEPTKGTWNGEGAWTIVDDGVLTPAAMHSYRVFADVEVTEPPTGEPGVCEDTDSTGIVVPNSATITSGAYEADDSGCQVVQWDDVSIEKTSTLPEGKTAVEPGDVFDYVLTVTNNGTRAATDVTVTDELNERLDILGLTVEPEGLQWGPAPGYEGRNVSLTIPTLPAGGEAVITIQVTLTADTVTDTETVVGPGDEPPAAPKPLEVLKNEACVAATLDGDASNNCDTEDIPVDDLTGVVFLACVSDAAQLGWNVARSGSLVGEPISLSWVPNNGTPSTVPQSVELSQAGGNATWADVIDWPGSAYTPSGVAIDYPGWRAIGVGDIVPGSNPTQYYLPGTTEVMTPEQQDQFVYNGLILDPSELDFAWREGSTVTFTSNPSISFPVGYPAATPEDCAVARQSDVQIEKTASVERTEPGKSFTYDLAVANVSDDSAADGVAVTDAIPADIRVTDVTWTGKGDASVFPNWNSCQVTGQGAGGFGGTLTCELFGPLQPVGSVNGGASAAPTITLAATVSPTAKGGVITNVGVVDYYTFGDPDDAGRDQDDAIVLLSGLPVTGGGTMLPLAILALLALVGGVGVLTVMRRRKGESQPVL